MNYHAGSGSVHLSLDAPFSAAWSVEISAITLLRRAERAHQRLVRTALDSTNPCAVDAGYRARDIGAAIELLFDVLQAEARDAR
jgi:hypothetical protein